MNAGPPERPEETLLMQAIADIQGSIHANDNKSAAGLVVQGLLSAAVVTVVTHLGGVYEDGADGAQHALVVLLALVVVTALVSILYLVSAIFPYDPRRIAGLLKEREGPAYKEIFFPDIERIREAAETPETFDAFTSSFEGDVRSLQEDSDAVIREYVAELLKVADIRAHEAEQAKIGFIFLGVEVVLVAAYLVVAGCIAGHIAGFAAPTGHPPAMRWSLESNGAPRAVRNRTRLAVRPGRKLEVRLIVGVDGAGLNRVRLTRRTTLRCVRHGQVRNVLAGPPSFQRVNSLEEDITLTTEIHAQHRRCPFRLRYAGFAERFLAVAEDAAGNRSAGWLILQGPIYPSGA